jgi:uncharacterized protein YraI
MSHDDHTTPRSTAPILNYNLPDATTYTGSFFTEFNLGETRKDKKFFRDEFFAPLPRGGDLPADAMPPNPTLFLVEEYRFSSFHGDYGAGRTLRTFTLMPGEETTLSLTSYKRTETTVQQASSVLDSHSQESASEFEREIQREQGFGSSQSYSTFQAKAKASAKWGFRGARAKGQVSSASSHSARSHMARSVFNAASKNSSRASAQRNVEINTSFEAKTVQGETRAVTRTIRNPNLSRTLNLVFRQLNQEFISVLHLVDIKVGFATPVEGQWRVVPLHELWDLIQQVHVYNLIMAEVMSIVDTDRLGNNDGFLMPVIGEGEDEPVERYYINPYHMSSVTRTGQVSGESAWLTVTVNTAYTGETGLNIRSGPGLRYDIKHTVEAGDQLQADFSRVQYSEGYEWLPVQTDDGNGWAITPRLRIEPGVESDAPPADQRSFSVPGVVMGVRTFIMRTDSVIVDALLGQSPALDDITQRSRRLDNELKQITIDRFRLREDIVREGNMQKAQIYGNLFPADHGQSANGRTLGNGSAVESTESAEAGEAGD